MTSEGSTRVLPNYGAVAAAKVVLESHVRQLAVELAESLKPGGQPSTLTIVLALAFFAVSFVFVYRSFFGMRRAERSPASPR